MKCRLSGVRAQLALVVFLTLAGASACGGQDGAAVPAVDGRVIPLPGASPGTAFDDIVYSPRLRRLLVPARDSGLYVVDPAGGKSRRVRATPSVDSADAGHGFLFLLDRTEQSVVVVNATDGRRVAAESTTAPPDYVRYAPTTDELWVTEPAADPPGIEIFEVSDEAPPLRRVDFVRLDDGAEGLTLSPGINRAYTHSGNDLVEIALDRHVIARRLSTGCDGTHGFPRVDERDRLALAGCRNEGAVSLLSLESGRQLDRYETGGGAALPAYSARDDLFFARGDPGTTIVTLRATNEGLTEVGEATVPEDGHCLTADDLGHYWTCDSAQGTILRIDT